jgi:ceramide glucosyltransferase
MLLLDIFLLASLGFGFFLAVLQVFLLWHHQGTAPACPFHRPPISILKPLCGHDDSLAENLEIFASRIDYPDYELLLGVASKKDSAYPIAQALAAQFPERVRVILQRGEPGQNPKVNQLLTLLAAARHSHLVISDSNVRVLPGYLNEIAALLADKSVGLVTHPAAGVGECDAGAAMDNLHMTVGIGVGTVALKVLVGKDFVVGKSMAMRRADLEKLGGLLAYKDVIAEDHYIGKDVSAGLGKRVVFARQPVFCRVENRTLRGFHERYQRWGVLQRYAVGPVVYATQIFSNPLFFAVLFFAASPSIQRFLFLFVATLAKMLLDGAAARLLRPVKLSTLLYVPLKDAFLFASWLHGFMSDRISWRGRSIHVGATPRANPDLDFLAAEVTG